MQIEAGKFYRTRDGRKVGPVVNTARGRLSFPFQCGPETYTPWGTVFNTWEDPADLVAEWAETTPAEPASTSDIEWGEWGEIGSVLGDCQMQRINGVTKWRHPALKQPVVETVTLTGHNARGEGWSFAPFGNYHDAARITFDVIDGKPDWSTLRG